MIIYHMAICINCSSERPLAMPFDNVEDRNAWVTAHIDGTAHRVLMYKEGRPE